MPPSPILVRCAVAECTEEGEARLEVDARGDGRVSAPAGWIVDHVHAGTGRGSVTVHLLCPLHRRAPALGGETLLERRASDMTWEGGVA